MRVAIIADTHVNPRDDTSSSVYRVHANANRRVISVIKKINELDVDAVVHLGDFVHRIQGQPLRDDAIRRFREIMGELRAPLMLVPGNHDEGEKVTLWAPGHPVTDSTLARYRKDFGPDYYAKDLADARLIVLNSQLLGRSDQEEVGQFDFLQTALKTSKPVYVFQHHPFYLESPQEREHYDNLPQDVREEYLPLFTRAGVRAAFAGHVHNYFFNILGGTQFFVVPSTTFVRHDYTELFPFVPTDEAHGRNYVSKLGFFLLESDKDRAASTWIKTFGCDDPSRATRQIGKPAANLLGGNRALIGVDLRHDWATPRPVPYTALQDEFNRKHIRNDYFTASIFETAIALLRVPIQDLEEVKSRDRMRDLGRVGVRFIVFLYEHPSPAQVKLLNEAAFLIDWLEICAPMPRMETVSIAVGSCGLDDRIKLAFSEMGTSAAGAEAMAHYIWTGFDARRGDLKAHLEKTRQQGFASAVLRLERDGVSAKLIGSLADAAAAANTRTILYVRLSSVNGAEAVSDDLATARLVALLEIMARVFCERISIVTDTYADHDRGYYPRTGLVDRAYDLRMAGLAVSRLAGFFTGRVDANYVADDAIRLLDGAKAAIFLPEPSALTPESTEALIAKSSLTERWTISRLCSPEPRCAFEKGDLGSILLRIRKMTEEPVLAWSSREDGP